ncbi:hypothetical protein MJO29_013966 [Puccinia striiformis f. sp. tritici]|uniref:Putative tyrosine-protein phosphatase OCA1 n=1 Tax=Puccinia striiformis f. sp. tritici PST-78 TaxID=1165861 RepID=A0A0L0W481_9BASI|nr:hypothetical protein Pst134EA_026653 [Puccinia striiformis f. sp. tritici]KAH9449941.1 hypothetical protein Pst134EA_026653 [Puccinia striiformis f. sp. tritici]KAI7939230.1 hypothetical protein MJO29_013966 [Puccinia striiformis f. sp. tritici]KNF06282.1 hypothetical protein PSTG_00788 [Puccinia striiformis f. sp. tritici PST-78]
MNRRTSTTNEEPGTTTTTTNRLLHHHLNETTRSISRSNSFDTVPPHSPNPSDHQQQAQQEPTSSEQPQQINNNNSNLNLFDPLPHLPSRLRQATLKLVPPPNFGFIEGSLFRAGEPAELSLNFLHRLQLNSLLWLAPHPPSLKFQEFLSINSIEFNDLGIQHAASLDAVTEEAVTHALELILNPKIYPLMIMCGGGSHRTGTVVGCLRKLQGWNLASIFEEYRRYAGAQHHIMNEQFIEFYNVNRLAHRLSSTDEKQQDLNNLSPTSSSSSSATPVFQRATPSSGLNFKN